MTSAPRSTRLLADYIAAFSPVNPVVEGRITRVDAAAPEATPEANANADRRSRLRPRRRRFPSKPPTELPTTGAGVESWPLLAALLVLVSAGGDADSCAGVGA
jgi:hypothetical protein